jgi:hypothetical protein
MRVFILCICLMLLIPTLAFGEEEFIRGLWHTFEACCMAGHEYCFCCPDTLWGDSVISTNEQNLFNNSSANTLHSHFYGLNDFLPVLRYFHWAADVLVCPSSVFLLKLCLRLTRCRSCECAALIFS